MNLTPDQLLTEDIALLTLSFLIAGYIYITQKSNGQWNWKCAICNKNVRRMNEGRYHTLYSRERINWWNPLGNVQVKRFCSFEHLNTWSNKMDLNEMELQKVNENATPTITSK